MLLFILSIIKLSLSSQIEGCLDPNDFNSLYQDKFSEEVKTQSEILRISPLEYLFQKGKFLGKGAFGIVNEIQWGEKSLVAKEVDARQKQELMTVISAELNYLQIMCGFEKGSARTSDQICNTDTTVKLFGCMLKDNVAYIIQEPLYKDLEHPTSIKTYNQKSNIERLKILKRIAEKFLNLHSHNIIHCDIKPSNIMSVDSDLNDFRIIDLGLSTTIGSTAFEGTPLYNGLERIKQKTTAVPQIDIYSLGITFAVLEIDPKIVFKDIVPSCYKGKFRPFCHKVIMDSIKKSLITKKFPELIPIILKATEYQLKDRYESMGQLAEEIGKVITTLEKSEPAGSPSLDLNESPKSTKENIIEDKVVEVNKNVEEPKLFSKQIDPEIMESLTIQQRSRIEQEREWAFLPSFKGVFNKIGKWLRPDSDTKNSPKIHEDKEVISPTKNLPTKKQLLRNIQNEYIMNQIKFMHNANINSPDRNLMVKMFINPIGYGNDVIRQAKLNDMYQLEQKKNELSKNQLQNTYNPKKNQENVESPISSKNENDRTLNYSPKSNLENQNTIEAEYPVNVLGNFERKRFDVNLRDIFII